MRLTRALLLALALLYPLAASGFERSIFQYTHQSWSEESDAPRPVLALAQDLRGYIWAATGRGLFRFDGLRFEPIGAGIDLVVNGPPSALMVRRNGEVWTNFERSRRFAVYRDGRLRYLRAPAAPHRVMAMHESSDGTIWVLTERIGVPLMRFRHGKWASFGTDAGAPLDNPFSMVVTRQGFVWVSFSNGMVARLAPEAERFEFLRGDFGALGRLSIDPEERIWLTERHGSYPISGPRGHGSPPPLRHAYRTDAAEIRGWPRFDGQGNLWIATYYDGLQRVARPDPSGASSPAEAVSRVERFTSRDGLTANATAQILQDAEGNVWAGTENGLDKFWPATVHFEPQLTKPAAFGDLLLSASDGSVYIGQASTVYRVRPYGRPEPIFRTPVEPRTLCEAPDGAIWIGTNDKAVTIWRGGQALRLGAKAPLEYTIYDCAFDAEGGYWVTASLGGMARFSDGRWRRMQASADDDGFVPKSMVADEKGRVIVQWNDRILSRLGRSSRTRFPIPWAGYQADDVALHPLPGGSLLVGARFGLARLRSGRFESISARTAPIFSGVSGMVAAPDGTWWFAGSQGVFRIEGAELERAFADPAHVPAAQVFGTADGLRSRPHTHSRHSIVRGGDGRLWIATQAGTMWLDPAQTVRSNLPPRVAISSISADGRSYPDPVSLTLRPGSSNIDVNFAVLSFVQPRQVKVRYRLEGYEQTWQDSGTRRQAFYTNLPPGRYRFQLAAANVAGVWTRAGTAAVIDIPPTFVQTRWFLLLCLLLAAGLLWLLYRIRLAQVAARVRAGLEERLGERERIARELHDTLLQSVQGLVLRFQSVANKLPSDGIARARLESALERADEVIAEGRSRVQDLRNADRPTSLPEQLEERARSTAFDPPVPIRIIVEGKPRLVHPVVAAEIVALADEALFNVARHARAREVDITVRFTTRQLGVEIRDDGVGIPTEVLEQGERPGHFGLVGMRERAERIGGIFSVESAEGMGSTITTTLPARLAFADQARGRGPLSRLLARWRERKRA